MLNVDERHCMQYAVLIGLQFPNPAVVYGTEGMNDHEILRYLRDHCDELAPHAQYKLKTANLSSSSPINGVLIQRHDECLLCKIPAPCIYLIDRSRNR
jgi:hypothetical protein